MPVQAGTQAESPLSRRVRVHVVEIAPPIDVRPGAEDARLQRFRRPGNNWRRAGVSLSSVISRIWRTSRSTGASAKLQASEFQNANHRRWSLH